MQVSKEEVIKIASLARLELSDVELEKFTKDLSNILSYAKILDEVDVSGVKATIQVNNNLNVNRDDEVVVFDSVEGVLKESPQKIIDDMISVKNVF